MAGTVLDTMFVDIIARGVTDAGKAIRGLTQETEVAAAANRRLRDAMSDVGRASQGMSGSRGSQSAAAGNSPQAAGIGLSVACDKDSVKLVSAALEDAKLGRFAADFVVPSGCPAQWLTFSIAPGSGDSVLDDVEVWEP